MRLAVERLSVFFDANKIYDSLKRCIPLPLFKALLEASDEDIAAFQRIIDLFASKKD